MALPVTFKTLPGGVNLAALLDQEFEAFYDADGSDLISYTAPGSGSKLQPLTERLAQSISVVDKGAQPGTFDSTDAWKAAIAEAAALGVAFHIPFSLTGWTHGPVVIPANLTTIIIDGAWVSALSSGHAQDYPPANTFSALYEFQGQMCAIIGKLYIDMKADFGYANAVWISASGAVGARNSIFDNITVWRAQNSFVVGDPAWDTVAPSTDAERGISEVTLSGCITNDCFQALRAYGANSVISVEGSWLYNNRFDLYNYMVAQSYPTGPGTLADYVNSTPKPCFELHGATVNMGGGGSANFDEYPIVDSYPINTLDPVYGKTYGAAHFTGCNLEGGQLVQVLNPAGLTPTDTGTIFSAVNCCGFIGGNANTLVLMLGPAAGHGKFVVKDSTFHGIAVTTARIVSALATTVVDVDPKCFVSRSGNYDSIQAANILATDRVVALANTSVQTIASTGTVLILGGSLDPTWENATSIVWYNVATGEFTALRDLSRLEIEFDLPFTSGVVTDLNIVQLLRSGTPERSMITDGRTAKGTLEASNISVNDVFTLKVFSDNGRTLVGGGATYAIYKVYP